MPDPSPDEAATKAVAATPILPKPATPVLTSPRSRTEEYAHQWPNLNGGRRCAKKSRRRLRG